MSEILGIGVRLAFKNKLNHESIDKQTFKFLQPGEINSGKKKKKCKMHISHIQGAAAMMYKAIPVKSVCWGRADAFSEVGMGISKVHHLIKAWVTGRRAARC